MKNYRLIALLAFTATLLIGLGLGSILRKSIQDYLPSRRSIPTAETGQKNILLVYVDDLMSVQPRLEGIWLMVYTLPGKPLTLFPVYPGNGSGSQPLAEAANHQLEQTFRLDRKQHLDQGFIEILKSERRILWDGYIVLDKSAAALAVGAWSEYPGEDYGKTVVKSIPDPWENPARTLAVQQSVISNICDLSARLANQPRLNVIYREAKTHVATDLSLDQALAEWQTMLDTGDNTICEFPTFEKQSANTR